MWNYPEIRGLRQPTLCRSTGSADVLVGNKWRSPQECRRGRRRSRL